MTIIIQTPSSTIVSTWIAALEHLRSCTGDFDFNVILEIENPSICSQNEQGVLKQVDSFLESHDKASLKTVANTIFPDGLYRRLGSNGVYKIYPEVVFPRIMRCKENKWGTYAHRLVRRTSAKGEIVNPLATVIGRLASEGKNGGPKRARYELSMVDSFTDLSTGDTTLPGDNLALGGPCLTHLSFKLRPGGVLSLTAFYRSHFYMERALGNLIGLSRLLNFAANESGLKAGPITCISSYAQIDKAKWGLRGVDSLINECKRLLTEEAAPAISRDTALV